MEKRDEELILSVIETDPVLKKYWEEHLLFERQLEAFNRRIYLTPKEELERKRIQKLKLAGRDKMEEILSLYRHRQKEQG
jgi:hypothetical protein